MATIECIVHSQHHKSKYQAVLVQLRAENKFPENVLTELSKRCCLCDGNSGLTTIDLEKLREICEDIIMSENSTVNCRSSSPTIRSVLEKDAEEETQTSSSSLQTAPVTVATPDQTESKTLDTESEAESETSESEPKTSETESDTSETPGTHILSRKRNTLASKRLARFRILKSIRQKRFLDESQQSKRQVKKKDFQSALETFKPISVENSCIVHDIKCKSKFNNAMNLLRLTTDFTKSTFLAVPKRCCSCNGKTGLNVIDLKSLSDVCADIQSKDVKSSPLPFSELLILPFEEGLTKADRHRRTGRFIGKKGKFLLEIKEKYGVDLHIINESSVMEVPSIETSTADDKNVLQLLIKAANKTKIFNPTEIDQMKKEIIEKWNETSEFRFVERDFAFDEPGSTDRFRYISLPFEEEVSPQERRRRIGRFIGRKGEKFLELHGKYKIFIKVINNSCSEKVFRQIIQEQEKNEQKTNQENDVCLFIKTIENDPSFQFDEIEQDVLKLWTQSKQTNIKPWPRIPGSIELYRSMPGQFFTPTISHTITSSPSPSMIIGCGELSAHQIVQPPHKSDFQERMEVGEDD